MTNNSMNLDALSKKDWCLPLLKLDAKCLHSPVACCGKLLNQFYCYFDENQIKSAINAEWTKHACLKTYDLM